MADQTAADHLTFVLGGARSGKSRYAERIVTGLSAPWLYIATADPLDEEMAARIARHAAERADGWIVEEAPLDVAVTLRRHAVAAAPPPVLIDCLTLWLTNLMLRDRDAEKAIRDLVDALAAYPRPVVLVSNEVGLGIVPDNALARAFRDELGRLHQRLAAEADRVVFMVAGLPMVLKPQSAGH